MRFALCYYFAFRLKKTPQPLLFQIKRRENGQGKSFSRTPQTCINTGLFRVSEIIPTRSCQKFSKQICLWDLAQGIGIIFIIQIVEAI